MGKVCTFPKAVPEYTFGTNAVRQVSLGEAHSLVLDEKGAVYGFGWNDFGQLGIGNKV